VSRLVRKDFAKESSVILAMSPKARELRWNGGKWRWRLDVRNRAGA
jgi:hypothetical protein